MILDRTQLPFRTNCEGYFFTPDKRQMLAQKTSFGVIFPGGGVDEGEEVYAAMIRETREETGAVLANVREIGTLRIVWDADWAKTQKQQARYQQFQGDEMHFFTGTIQQFDPVVRQEDTWSDPKLMPLTDVKKLLRQRLATHENAYVRKQLELISSIV